MDVETIRAALNVWLDDKAGEFGGTTELDQTDLTSVTDGVADIASTVNPNGPCYPPTPR